MDQAGHPGRYSLCNRVTRPDAAGATSEATQAGPLRRGARGLFWRPPPGEKTGGRAAAPLRVCACATKVALSARSGDTRARVFWLNDGGVEADHQAGLRTGGR